MLPVRMSRFALVLGLAGALLLGACTLPTREQPHEPVTITHTLGATTVDKIPKKIVALGGQWTDTTLAFGITPVGYLVPDAAPWQPETLTTAKPLDTNGDLPAQIRALEPDLILMDGLLTERQRYDAMTAIAPTVPALSSQPADPWPDRVRALGSILDEAGTADNIIGGVDRTIAEAAPGLQGKTFVTTWLTSPDQLIVLTRPSTVAAALFTGLGLQVPTDLAALPAIDGRLTLPPDQIADLTADVLLAGFSDGLDQQYRELPGYSELPAVQRDSVVFLTTMELSGLEQPTALSVPYLLEKLRPALANATK